MRSWDVACPVCNSRKARRACPALGQTICPVCCATKRLVEINCPSDCPHLTAAREHPAAVVKRQQERDVAVLMPTIRELTERQYQLFFLFQTAIARHTRSANLGGAVTVNAESLYDLDGHNESIDALTLNGGGDVQTYPGQLTLDGDVVVR